jgi:hypothetical protein
MESERGKKMAAAKSTKKTTTRKTAGFEVTLDLAKTTKNTYRFENDEEGAPISTLYVNQSAFSSEPSSITVTVTVN